MRCLQGHERCYLLFSGSPVVVSLQCGYERAWSAEPCRRRLSQLTLLVSIATKSSTFKREHAPIPATAPLTPTVSRALSTQTLVFRIAELTGSFLPPYPLLRSGYLDHHIESSRSCLNCADGDAATCTAEGATSWFAPRRQRQMMAD